jgi:hypothetical protein
MKKILMFGLAVAVTTACLAANATPAKAACNIYSAVPVRVQMSGTAAYVYYRPHVWYDNFSATKGTKMNNSAALSSVYGYALINTSTVQGAMWASAAANAVTSQTRILIYGNATTCPNATGSGYIGTVTSLVVNP